MVSKEQRRRQLAREKFQRQQQRRSGQREQARKRNAVIAAVLAVVVAGGGGIFAAVAASDGGDDKASAKDPASTPPSEAPTSKAPDPCEKPAKGTPSTKTWKKEPALTLDTKAKQTMTLDTTCGKITVDLKAAKAPHTVNSFAFLAEEGYFDHSPCHRVTTDGIFVLQCGDPQGGVSPGPGYTIPDENLKDPSIKGNNYPAGTVAVANQYDPSTGQGRNSGSSQFFLVYKDSPLPPDYTPFGTITDGLDVVTKIAKAGTQTGTPDGPPAATVVINKAAVTAKG